MPDAGTAATAEAVSCEAVVVTRVPMSSPVRPRTSGSSEPAISPGRRRGGKIAGLMPARSSTPVAQPPVLTSSICVVEALVSSAATAPVSQYVSRSGSRSSVRAASSCGVPAAARSWHSVLIGITGTPVIR